MIDLKNIKHSANLAHITITRLGESRSTRYQISPQVSRSPEPKLRAGGVASSEGEAKQEREAKPYDPRAAVLASDFLKERYGHIFKEEG
jgi:hypothetical protein